MRPSELTCTGSAPTWTPGREPGRGRRRGRRPERRHRRTTASAPPKTYGERGGQPPSWVGWGEMAKGGPQEREYGVAPRPAQRRKVPSPGFRVYIWRFRVSEFRADILFSKVENRHCKWPLLGQPPELRRLSGDVARRGRHGPPGRWWRETQEQRCATGPAPLPTTLPPPRALYLPFWGAHLSFCLSPLTMSCSAPPHNRCARAQHAASGAAGRGGQHREEEPHAAQAGHGAGQEGRLSQTCVPRLPRVNNRTTGPYVIFCLATNVSFKTEELTPSYSQQRAWRRKPLRTRW